MRIRIVVIAILMGLGAAVLASAQSSQELYSKALNEEQLGRYDAAIKIYERIIREFPRERQLVAKAKLHLGDCYIKSGERKGLDVLKDVMTNYRDQTNVVNDAQRVVARASAPVSRLPKWSEHDYLLVAEFNNATGDPLFDVLSTALTMQLNQSPYLDVYPYERVLETLRRLRRPPTERLTHAVAREICEKAGVKGSLLPSITGMQGRYVLVLEVVNCSSAGESFARLQVEANGNQDVLGKLGSAASSLRAALGERPESIQQFDTPRVLTTNSLAALAAYSLAYRVRVSNGALLRAQNELIRAVKLDPNFASAYSLLATLGIDNTAERNYAATAYALRDQVSDRERLTIEAQYQATFLGDVEKTIATLERQRSLYPRDGDVRILLGNQYRAKGLFEKALVELHEAVELDPTNSVARESLMRCYLELNKFSEARAVYEQSVDAEADGALGIHTALYSLAFTEGNTATAQQQLNWLNERAIWWQDQTFVFQNQSSAFGGDLPAARRFLEGILNNGSSLGPKAFVVAAESRAEALYGNSAEARTLASTALEMSRSIVRISTTIVAYGLAGDQERVKALTDEIKEKYPEDTYLNLIWVPTATAALEVRKGNGAAALKLLEPAASFEPSANSMWAAYVRGLAYLQTGSGRAAAAEFQKIIDHQGVDLLSPLYPMAHLRLADAHTLMGDGEQAQKRYQDFVKLWNNADPTLPVLVEAKAKYEKPK